MIKIEKKTMKQTCWACEGKGCKVCNKTGKWTDSIYYFIVIGKDGKKYAIDSDNLA